METEASLHIKTLGPEPGLGPELVMLHGWAMHGGFFDAVIEPLSQVARLHIVDLPGHGQSPLSEADMSLQTIGASVVAAMNERLSVPAVWLGWSLGGLVAINIAESFPDRVSGLILTACNPCFVKRADWPDAIEAEVLQTFAADLQRDYGQTLMRFLSLQVRGAANERQTLRRLRQILHESPVPQARALQAGLDILLREDRRSALQALDIPLLFLGGEKDMLALPEALRTVAEQHRAGCLLWPQAGHAPFLSQPQMFTDAVKGFLHEQCI